MFKARASVGVFLLVALGLLACAQQAVAEEAGFTVGGELALASLESLGDAHLQKMVDSLHMLAATEAVRSAEWERIQGPLAELAGRNTPALNWFALPDGSYWSVQEGKEPGSLARREYFPRVLAGETIIGELVISTATGKPVAIVAVPVNRADGSVAGVLGASIYLEALSETIRRQMGIGEGMIFYSFDDDALVALIWDQGLIFFEPMKAGDEALAAAFEEMLSKEAGVASYTFQGRDRTVAFRKSPLSGWRYAFGVVSPAP
jgi:hypothetical protein